MANEQIKLVGLDLSGSLVKKEGSRSIIEARDSDALLRAKEMGIENVGMSGQSMQYIENAVEMAKGGLSQYAIAGNGALVRDMGTGKDIFKAGVTDDEVRKLYQLYKDLGGLFFMSHAAPKTFREESENIGTTNSTQKIADYDFFEVIERNPGAFMSAIIGAHPGEKGEAKLEEARMIINKMFPNLVTTNICYNTKDIPYIDIGNEKASKGNALKAIADFKGVNKSGIMTIAKGANDESAWDISGTSIVMESAKDKQKKFVLDRGGYITKSVADAYNKSIFDGREDK